MERRDSSSCAHVGRSPRAARRLAPDSTWRRRAASLMLTMALAADMPAAAALCESMTAETIELAAGASARLGSSEFTLLFEKVDLDARCPKGVTCVWEGDAVVRFSVGAPGQPKVTLLLHTHPDRQREAVTGGFRIRLVALAPYPSIDRTPRAEEYRVELNVTAAE
ncbi:MAG: hypothetical protein ACRD1U_09725 [Vicinamibacterales bacterium]